MVIHMNKKEWNRFCRPLNQQELKRLYQAARRSLDHIKEITPKEALALLQNPRPNT